ncbi:MAG TPA: hypothetical protein ENH02_05810 [Bacteroidetes bacterium]|nr:hypothetical protein [Bacteroidota bacterium]
MNDKMLNRILWLVAVVITLLLVVYQRTTGPSYPMSGTKMIGSEKVAFKFLRSYDTGKDAPVWIRVHDKAVTGKLIYKRYKSHDEWTETDMKTNAEGNLAASIPSQPPAGKVMYIVNLFKNGKEVVLTEEPVILRYKGAVPQFILVPHIFFMFISLLFGIRAGLEALFRRKDTKYQIGVTLITLFLGGLILGPIVQKFAFGAYWTGWPFGHDLTDNKTFIIFIFWLIAWFRVKKNAQRKTWPVIATLIMIAVYIIPHSAWGSEIDYTKQKTEKVQTNTTKP